MTDYRAVRTDDLELVSRHRHEMFKASGRSEAVLGADDRGPRPAGRRGSPGGDYFGWIAEVGRPPVGGLG